MECRQILQYIVEHHSNGSGHSLDIAAALNMDHRTVLRWLNVFNEYDLYIDVSNKDTHRGNPGAPGLEIIAKREAANSLEMGFCESLR